MSLNIIGNLFKNLIVPKISESERVSLEPTTEGTEILNKIKNGVVALIITGNSENEKNKTGYRIFKNSSDGKFYTTRESSLDISGYLGSKYLTYEMSEDLIKRLGLNRRLISGELTTPDPRNILPKNVNSRPILSIKFQGSN